MSLPIVIVKPATVEMASFQCGGVQVAVPVVSLDLSTTTDGDLVARVLRRERATARIQWQRYGAKIGLHAALAQRVLLNVIFDQVDDGEALEAAATARSIGLLAGESAVAPIRYLSVNSAELRALLSEPQRGGK